VFDAVVFLSQPHNLGAELVIDESAQCLHTVLDANGIHQGMAEGERRRRLLRRVRRRMSAALYHLCFQLVHVRFGA
jgi:hypothetical protein